MDRVINIREIRPDVEAKIKTLVPLVLAVLAALILATGFYTVDSGEEAVVLRFGRHVDTVVTSGLKWRIPLIDKVWKIKVSELRRLEFGFRTVKEGANAQYVEVPQESLMLTGDENLINVETIVQYRIVDIEKYLFLIDKGEEALRAAAEATIRRVIANHPMDAALTENKSGIQQEIRDDLQYIVDRYNLGVMITAVQLQDVYPPDEVDDAFKDVASAREDRAAFINQAETYANEVIPRARGNAAEAINKAEAFKEQRIAQARGDVALFNEILAEYRLGPEVTRTRLYLEVLEEILPGMEVYILDEQGNTIKWLPIGGGMQ
ncbi:MAG: FtsH protease activity modulator HflK [Firmicutes bacterium]|nr:FtsH protease activity modulator HflK [Bacillota bacterium]HOB35503.1 FtsH protease activity modulator HflK [Bacillota bacterium]HPZ91087.1 FtsH protease activity modulator HflK [Bacillota bacterium]HQE01878.1 FtsH protease activity modulator HflK [Bacillota bacterium]